MTISPNGYHHVRLTVTDFQRSKAFYDSVFGLPVAVEVPADADEATKKEMWWVFGGCIYQLGDGLFGLRPVAPEGDSFDPDRVGLDHIGFKVNSKSEIDAFATQLDSLGVAHEGVKDIGMGWILEFRDPDNISLELFAPAD